jgi:hypothetical protein
VASNDIARLYQEQSSYVLPQSVTVDLSQPGFCASRGATSSSTIPAGTEVDVFYLHYDSIGNQSATIYDGRINFSGRILGVICQDQALNASDSVLGAEGTQYPTGQRSRGYEWGAERVELSQDMQSFIIHRFHVTFPGENTRILTEPGGAPASYGMNNQVRNAQRMQEGQVMFTDYEKTVIDLDLMGNSDFKWNDQTGRYDNEYMALRHFGRANVLYCNGSVRSEGDRAFFNPGAFHWRQLED